MITFTETFLSITMEALPGKIGYKGFGHATGATHQLKVYNISNKRNVYREGQASYSQTTTPTSELIGREPDIITIDGPLCYLDSTGTMVSNYLGSISNHNVNTLYNAFIPCSILAATSTVSPDVSGKNWIVSTFKIKRNTQKRSIVMFELVLYRWYGALPSPEEGG